MGLPTGKLADIYNLKQDNHEVLLLLFKLVFEVIPLINKIMTSDSDEPITDTWIYSLSIPVKCSLDTDSKW